MRKNFIFVFALMFALVLVSAGSVMAFSAKQGLFINGLPAPDTLNLLTNVNMSYTINISMNLTHELVHNGNFTKNITQIKVELPSSLRLITGTAIMNITSGSDESDYGLSGKGNYTNSSVVRTNATEFIYINTSVGGIRLYDNTSNQSVSRHYNLTITFNVTAVSTQLSAPIKISVLYNDTAASGLNLWNSTTVNTINVYNKYNISWEFASGVPSRFNEDVESIDLVIKVNNTNVCNYPAGIVLGNDTLHSKFPIAYINMTLSSNLLSASSGANSNHTKINNGSYRFERYSATQIGWVMLNATLGSSPLNSSISQNFTLRFTSTQPGNFSILVNVSDYSNATNIYSPWNSTTLYNITVLDTTIPSNITFSCSPVALYLGEIVTCTCSTGWDNYYTATPTTGGSCTGCATSITATDTTQTGTYTETCTVTDGNGNVGTATASYTVNSAGESVSSAGPGGAGSGYTGATTHNANTLSATSETTLSSKAEENIEFKTTTGTTAGTSFIGTVDAVTETSATITIVDASGENKAIAVDVGSVVKVDLDGDDVYDLSIGLSSITDGKAKFAMKEISEVVPLEEREQETTEEGGATEEKGGIAEAITKNLTWLWVALGVVVVIVVIFFLTQKKKSPVTVFFLTLFSKNGRALKRRR